jgi:hypothetical protein
MYRKRILLLYINNGSEEYIVSPLNKINPKKCRTHLTFWFSSFDSCVFFSAIVFSRVRFFPLLLLFCSFCFSSFLSFFPLLLLRTHSLTLTAVVVFSFLSEYCVSRTLCSFSFFSFFSFFFFFYFEIVFIFVVVMKSLYKGLLRDSVTTPLFRFCCFNNNCEFRKCSNVNICFALLKKKKLNK